MSDEIKAPPSPTGLSRILFRLPIFLYRARLGWLLGQRFLLLNHTGRSSGLPRQAVLEVVRFDEESGSYIVAAGFGPKSQWYQNLRKAPEVKIQVGRRKLAATADFLAPEQGADEMANYAQVHPRAARALARLMGYNVNGSDEEYAALGKTIPFVAFQPR
jgi:deazaflavin-dependent oxidoreductase (nitroreductase family)